MDHGQIGPLFGDFHQLLQTQTPPGPFTFAEPHSCEHCRDDCFQLDEQDPMTPCRLCRSDDGHTITSPGYVSCKGYGTVQEKLFGRIFSVTFRHAFSDAIAAARSGCALYGIYAAEITLDGTPGSFSTEARLTSGSSVLYVQRLQGWTTADDPASKYLIGRPYEPDVDSDASWHFARRCLNICREQHGLCRGRLMDTSDVRDRRVTLVEESTRVADIPSRLLDVQNEDSIRLVELKHAPHDEKLLASSLGFAALSYCWGGQQSVILTRALKQHLLDGFSKSELPKTIQDAIRTVKKLGLRYLWVDALCIEQDNDEDKGAEIGHMATYYGSATVTICAAAALRSDQGFLFRRKVPSFEAGPFRLALFNKNGANEGHVYLLKDSEAPPEHTTTRGWTMQESLLSRRMLVDADRQLYWVCNTSTAGCNSSEPPLVEKAVGSARWLVDGIYPIEALITRPTYNQWSVSLRNYTTRHLGVPGDKLLAISSLVAHLMEIAKKRKEDPVYIAGLFVLTADESSLHTQLLWHASERSKLCRTSTYRAPSWSWAAMDGPIMTSQSRVTNKSPVHRPEEIAVIHSHVDLVYQNLPLGSVKGGSLTIQAKRRRFSECINFPNLPITIRGALRGLTDLRHGIDLLPDTDEDLRHVQHSIGVDGASGSDLFLIVLFSFIDKGVRLSEGLLVSRNNSGDMTRVGVFQSFESKDPKLLFKDCETALSRLV
ncbi:hypothetical protein FDECE_16599 [Fusarium decemcellulare]|nr:hypothetical protein FDECE_16599 [Fusarium decemcellulare]